MVAEEASNFLYIQHCGPGTTDVPYSPVVLMSRVAEEASNFL